MSPPFPPAPRLPDSIVLLEERIDSVAGALLDCERPGTERMVPKRLREFTAGRALARQALQALGLEPAAIPAASDRKPSWPPGVVGSISHTDEHVGVALSRDAALLGIGLDLESAVGLPPETIALVATEGEQRFVERWPPGERGLIYKRLFSAKEAVFKCTYPRTGVWLDFLDVELDLDDTAATFHTRFLKQAPRTSWPQDLDGTIQASPQLIRSTLFWHAA